MIIKYYQLFHLMLSTLVTARNDNQDIKSKLSQAISSMKSSMIKSLEGLEQNELFIGHESSMNKLKGMINEIHKME